jgi:hypothetical protein
LPTICVGSKPVDGGHYIFNEEERRLFLAQEPEAASILRPFIGSSEYINGIPRWILFPEGMTPQDLRALPAVMDRISAVRSYRTEGGNLARELASRPTQYHVTVVPTEPFLAIPEVSSERREYIPIGWLEPPTIPSNKLLIVPNAKLELFSLIISKMHMVWVAYIGGRLKSDFQYSGGIVYNTLPTPTLDSSSRTRLSTLGQAVLDARTAHSGSTLADLYDPDTMPSNLRSAHRALDAAVDRLYKRSGFSDDRERVEHLFGLYESMLARLPIREPRRARRSRGAARASP